MIWNDGSVTTLQSCHTRLMLDCFMSVQPRMFKLRDEGSFSWTIAYYVESTLLHYDQRLTPGSASTYTTLVLFYRTYLFIVINFFNSIVYTKFIIFNLGDLDVIFILILDWINIRTYSFQETVVALDVFNRKAIS